MLERSFKVIEARGIGQGVSYAPQKVRMIIGSGGGWESVIWLTARCIARCDKKEGPFRLGWDSE
jgi:hypothetical protein